MFEFLASVFVFGSALFWTTAVGFSLAVLISVGSGHKVAAFLLGLVAAVLLGAGHASELFSLVVNHPVTSSALVALYFIIGAAWSVFKWFKYLVNWRDERLASNPNYFDSPQRYLPSAKEHKGDITGWIIFWPISAVIYLVWDLVADVANRIYKLLAGLYDQVTTYVFKDVRPNATVHHINQQD